VIPVVLCIDAEPDGLGHDPADGPWTGFRAMHRWLGGLRGRIEDVTGRPPAFAWFLRMDPQVAELGGTARYPLDAHPDVRAEILDRNEPLGLHVHGWRRGADGSWVDDFGDQPWLAECIDSSYAAFAEAFGVPCRLSRMGARFLDARTATHLAAKGTVVDLSLEPANDGVPSGRRPTVAGELPDCRRTPRAPHRLPSGLVELPLSATRRVKGWHPRRHAARVKHHGLLERLDHPVQMARPIEEPDTFGRQVERTLAGQRHPYLAYALRSDGVIQDEKRARIEAQMDQLLGVLAGQDAAFVGPEEAVALLPVR
jgi:hypothetical protein